MRRLLLALALLWPVVAAAQQVGAPINVVLPSGPYAPFLAPGATTPLSTQQKLSGCDPNTTNCLIFNAKDYNFLASGSATPNGVALKAAWNAACVTHGLLRLPPGGYSYDSSAATGTGTLTCGAQGFTMSGETGERGTVLLPTNTGATLFDLTGVSQTIANLGIYESDNPSAGADIVLDTAQQVTLHDLTLGGGYRLIDCESCLGVHINNVYGFGNAGGTDSVMLLIRRKGPLGLDPGAIYTSDFRLEASAGGYNECIRIEDFDSGTFGLGHTYGCNYGVRLIDTYGNGRVTGVRFDGFDMDQTQSAATFLWDTPLNYVSNPFTATTTAQGSPVGVLTFASTTPGIMPGMIASTSAFTNSIASITWSGGVATATTTAPLNAPLGQHYFYISGNSPVGYNTLGSPYKGTLVTVTGSNTFTWAVASNPGTPTVLGTAQWYVLSNDGITSTQVPLIDLYSGAAIDATSVANSVSVSFSLAPGDGGYKEGISGIVGGLVENSQTDAGIRIKDTFVQTMQIVGNSITRNNNEGIRIDGGSDIKVVANGIRNSNYNKDVSGGTASQVYVGSGAGTVLIGGNTFGNTGGIPAAVHDIDNEGPSTTIAHNVYSDTPTGSRIIWNVANEQNIDESLGGVRLLAIGKQLVNGNLTCTGGTCAVTNSNGSDVQGSITAQANVTKIVMAWPDGTKPAAPGCTWSASPSLAGVTFTPSTTGLEWDMSALAGATTFTFKCGNGGAGASPW